MYSIISEVVSRLLGLVELLLFLRLTLKFFNASPRAFIVNLIYKYTGILVSPFEFIFPDIYWPKGYLIETATISAMLGYWILVLIFFQLLRLFSRD
ncbi:MAG: hypothetical protein ACE5GI_04035 [Candidatus Aminicenantales bacterium]